MKYRINTMLVKNIFDWAAYSPRHSSFLAWIKSFQMKITFARKEEEKYLSFVLYLHSFMNPIFLFFFQLEGYWKQILLPRMAVPRTKKAKHCGKDNASSAGLFFLLYVYIKIWSKYTKRSYWVFKVFQYTQI